MSKLVQRVADISAVSITLEVDNRTALFVLLADDGSVNRGGTGSEDNEEHQLFIDRTDPPILPILLNDLTDEMLQFTGAYDVAQKRGARCRLTIALHFADGHEDGFRFDYGSKSKGPPKEIAELVSSAVDLTEPWYQEQKRLVATTQSGKRTTPWWRFW
jgi:hypothetical protein